ncbi:PREDICTED: transcription factor bHLH11-like isoform X3 [Brassica oleracea var. oleracea]|uniref:transcription factor bHLH11-like isoform X3 n=1 Tax=Brassica oleracea var. oleracea TaxID=109376 RepID=UPI0006A6EA4F|nr:PREDICTED: transcription factor bHLH11-like isoform X3 [Brassica oleracea var. oleracea]
MEQLKKLKTSSDDESSTASSSWGHNISFRPEKMVDGKEEPVSSRKIQKAEREKIRRDKLKKHVFELGDALDPNRPKSDKASILIDTVQILKDLMTQVDRLKAEYVTLSQESRELNQDKSELREENSSLKSDIEILSAQCQHRVMVPWIPHYAYPLPVVAITQASLGPKMERKDDVGLELELKIHASSSAHDASGKEEKGNSTVTASSSNSYYSSSHAVQDCSP